MYSIKVILWSFPVHNYVREHWNGHLRIEFFRSCFKIVFRSVCMTACRLLIPDLWKLTRIQRHGSFSHTRGECHQQNRNKIWIIVLVYHCNTVYDHLLYDFNHLCLWGGGESTSPPALRDWNVSNQNQSFMGASWSSEIFQSPSRSLSRGHLFHAVVKSEQRHLRNKIPLKK